MSRNWIAVASVCFVLTMAAMADAKPKAKLPKITGGGAAENFNAGPSFPDTFTDLGFNAQATGEGDLVAFPPFVSFAIVYPAKGQIQMKNVLADDPSVTDSQLHGEVVCIANLGPSGLIDGGADPDVNVWEIRFLITKAKGVDLSVFPPLYGSIFVQDGGKNDFMDETFGNITFPNCVINPFFELEPLFDGNIVVHD